MGRRAIRTTGSGAYVLADVLRTDRARLRPLIPGSPATATLGQACRARKDLVRHRAAVGNHSCAPTCCARSPCGWPVLQAPLGDQPGLLGPLRLPVPGRLAVAETAGRLTESRQLQRPQ